MALGSSRYGSGDKGGDGDRGSGPLVSRRSARSLVRWRNRLAGNYYDGTPFTGKVRTRPLVPTVLSGSSVQRGSGMPHAGPVPAAREFVRNSEAHPAPKPQPHRRPCKSPGCEKKTKVGDLCDRCFKTQGVHPCKDCGVETPKRFMRCKPCFDKTVQRFKVLQETRA